MNIFNVNLWTEISAYRQKDGIENLGIYFVGNSTAKKLKKNLLQFLDNAVLNNLSY